MEQTSLLNYLFIAAFSLLVLVSGGVLYLTSIEWRNRRLQNNEKRKK